MTARSACSRGPRVPSMYTHSAFLIYNVNTHERTRYTLLYITVHLHAVYIERPTCPPAPCFSHIAYHSSHPITHRVHALPLSSGNVRLFSINHFPKNM